MPVRPYHQPCSIARSLEVVGERWSLLIVREVLLGARRFEEIQRRTGAATNMLSDRLQTLVEHEVLRKRPYGDRSDRFEYYPTRKGVELAPVLWALMRWGDRWADEENGPPRVLVHTTCGHDTEAVPHCAHCGEQLDPAEVVVRPGPSAPDSLRELGVVPLRTSSV